MNPRHRLPNRREAVTEDMSFDGLNYMMTVGFNAEGALAEMFISTEKGGSLIDRMLEDFAVVVSVALQSGVSAEALGRSVGRLPDIGDALTPCATAPASPFGQVLDRLAEIEREAEG